MRWAQSCFSFLNSFNELREERLREERLREERLREERLREERLREERLREEKEQQQEELLQLQNGRVSLSPEEEEEPSERIMGMDLSTWQDRSYERREQSLSRHEASVVEEAGGREDTETKDHSSTVIAEAPGSIPTSTVVVRERTRTLDEPSQKTTRAKRESRRMRELEQAKFSLELLKVRAIGGDASSPVEERRWSLELVPPATPPLCSPQGTPDSQSSKGSFELLIMDEEPPKAVEEVTDSDEPCSPPPSVPEPDVEVVPTSRQPEEPQEPQEPQEAEVPDVTEPGSQGQSIKDPAAASAPTHPPKIENYLPTFYVPASEGSTVIARRPAEEPPLNPEAAAPTASPTVTKPRKESTRRPVVVVISMQKEVPLSEELSDILCPPVEVRDSAAQTGELTPSPQKPEPATVPQGPVPASTSVPQADPAVIEKLVRLNEEKEERQRNRRQQNEKEMMEQIRQQKEVLERQRLHFAQYERDMFEKQREEALHRIQLSRQGGQDVGGTQTSGKPLRPSSLAPHARTQSDSTAPSVRAPPAVVIKGSAPYPQLPPPPASAHRGKHAERAAEGWAPKLKLESREGGAGRARTTARKPPSQQATVNMTDKTGNIFFSPKDKVTFTKWVMTHYCGVFVVISNTGTDNIKASQSLKTEKRKKTS